MYLKFKIENIYYDKLYIIYVNLHIHFVYLIFVQNKGGCVVKKLVSGYITVKGLT